MKSFNLTIFLTVAQTNVFHKVCNLYYKASVYLQRRYSSKLFWWNIRISCIRKCNLMLYRLPRLKSNSFISLSFCQLNGKYKSVCLISNGNQYVLIKKVFHNWIHKSKNVHDISRVRLYHWSNTDVIIYNITLNIILYVNSY